MRRLAFIFVLFMTLCFTSARAETALDAAFDAGAVALVETENAGFDLSACDIVIPDGFWTYNEMEKPSDAGLAGMVSVMLPQAEVFSVSPAGTSALVVSDNVVFGLNGSTITALYPNEERGVTDEYGNMRKLYGRGLHTWLGEEGIVWSHDGRYAVLLNNNLSLVNAQFIFDPMLIDTATGDIFLTATYATKPKDGGGTVTSACFSADDRYLYYTFYGNLGTFRCSLLRCDLTTGGTELLHNGDTWIYYPQLAELRDGSLAIIADVIKQDESTGVARLTVGSSSSFWKKAPESVASQSQAIDRWTIGVRRCSLPARQWYVKRMEYSAASGWAISIGSLRGSSWGLQVFRPDEDFEGLDRYWVLKADPLAFTPMPEDDPECLFVKSENGEVVMLAPDYLYLTLARLSPDGRYALIEAGREGRFQLLLVRLEDMKAVPVEGIDSAALLAYGTGFARQYPPGIEWNGDQLLILTEAGLKTYRIDTGD